MSSSITPNIFTFTAQADLSAKKYAFVKFGTASLTVIACSVLGEGSIGVLMNAPVLGDPAEVAVFGAGAKVKLAANVTRGAELSVAATGFGTPALATHKVLALAMETGVTGDVIPVQVIRSQL